MDAQFRRLREARAQLAVTVSAREAEQIAMNLSRSWTVLDVTAAAALEAMRAAQQYQFQYFDGLIWATAKLNGVPFFAINRTFSANGDRMWEKNTPEHTEFRRQLFLRLSEIAKAPASDFQKLLSLDQYTPEQSAEVNAARASLGGRSLSAVPTARVGAGTRARSERAAEPIISPPPGGTPSPSIVRVALSGMTPPSSARMTTGVPTATAFWG